MRKPWTVGKTEKRTNANSSGFQLVAIILCFFVALKKSFLLFCFLQFGRSKMIQAAIAGYLMVDMAKMAISKDSRNSTIVSGVEWLSAKVKSKLLNQQEDMDETLSCETSPCSMTETCPDLQQICADFAPTQYDDLSSQPSAFELECTQNGTSYEATEDEDLVDETQLIGDGDFLVSEVRSF